MNTDQMINLASQMMEKAYAPYSNFQVGAALLSEDGQLYGGCNIENASYGLTNCAERTAIFQAIAQGSRKFKALLITGNTDDVITPCGACRQVISEFCSPKMPVYLTNQNGKVKMVTVEKLLPGAFNTEDLSHAK